MRLRPLNKSRRKQLDDHAVLVGSALWYHDRKYADRHGDGAIQRINARLHAEGAVDKVPDVPERTEVGSAQSVKIFRPLKMSDTLHPDALEFFDRDELAEVIDQAAKKTLLRSDYYQHFDYVGDGGSEHAAMVGFQTEGQEKGDIEHLKKIEARNAKNKRRAERAGHKVEQNLTPAVDEDEAKKAREEAKKWAGIRRELKAEIRDRYEYGFYHPGGGVADHPYEPFAEFFGKGILRSDLGSPSLARMAALYPKVSRLRAGYDKTALLTTTSKLLALDCPYVELDRKRAGCIVIELDSVLRVKEFREALLAILGPRLMPNLIVGRITASGFLSRPHLIWILKTPVWYDPYRVSVDKETGEVHATGDKRCSTKAISKFLVVQRALVSMLLPLGADPACHNIWKPKNPLSPFWTTFVANDDYWANLDDFRSLPGYPKRAMSEYDMHRIAAEMRAKATGAHEKGSNLLWRTVGAVLEPMMNKCRYDFDQEFMAEGLKSTQALAVWVEKRIRPVLVAELGESDALDRVLTRRCFFAAALFRKQMHSRNRPVVRKRKKRDENGKLVPVENENGHEIKKVIWRNRDRDFFRLRETIDESLEGEALEAEKARVAELDLKARQAFAGKRSGSTNRSRTYWAFAKCIMAWLAEGGAPDWLAFRKDGYYECCENTARQYWDRAIAELCPPTQIGDARYIAQPSSGTNDHPSPALATVRSTDSIQSIQSTQSTQSTPPSPSQNVGSPSPYPDNPTTAVGPPDPPRQIDAQSSADMRTAVVNRIPEPA